VPRYALIALVLAFAAAGPLPGRAEATELRPRCATGPESAWSPDGFAPADASVWRVSWADPTATDPAYVGGVAPPRPRSVLFGLPAGLVLEASQARPRPVAVEYSRGYEIRRTVHKWASIATLPLFAAEFAVGQSLYNNTANSDSKRGLHGALAGGIAGLFVVNSTTGVWNLWEARKDPNGRTRRVLHGILMLAADAGFVATGATAPDDGEGEHRLRTGESNGRARHRAIALTSMGTALASYLMMLFWRD
jgi:hypothetical protein